MSAPGVLSFRPIGPQDEPFLRRVYASTRAEELAPMAWPEEQKARFLDMQFDAQHRDYHARYAGAAFDLVLLDGQPIGRLYVHRTPEELHVLDIALLPEHRGRGIGGGLMRDILAEAEASGRSVAIYVERFNPALRLYERLGFRHVEDQSVYLFMRWTPPAKQAVS